MNPYNQRRITVAGRNQALPILFDTTRPKQWIKNLFIFAPALFTLRILDSHLWGDLLLGFIGFSLVSSAVYTLNDIFNRAEDRLHPVKKNRPIAVGTLSIPLAVLLIAILLSAGAGLLTLVSYPAVFIALAYFALMLLYTLWFRRLMIVDVIIIGIGFVLRVETGAQIINEPTSHWIILCTFTIALFLALIKRRQEIIITTSLPDDRSVPSGGRSVLSRYPNPTILDSWITVLAGMTILSYALYTVDPGTIAKHHTNMLLYTVPFVVYGIFRYHQRALTGSAGENPAQIVLTDTGIRFAVVLWVGAVGTILWIAGGH